MNQILSYAIVFSIAVFIPGPGILALISYVVNQGKRSGFLLLCGLIVGDLFYLSIVFLGLNQQINMDWLTVISGGYLIWFAYQLWGSCLVIEKQVIKKSNPLLQGTMVSLSNPKTMVFYLAILPTIFTDIDLQSKFLVYIITIIIFLGIGTLYIYSFKFLTVSLIKHQKIILRAVACVMAFLGLHNFCQIF